MLFIMSNINYILQLFRTKNLHFDARAKHFYDNHNWENVRIILTKKETAANLNPHCEISKLNPILFPSFVPLNTHRKPADEGFMYFYSASLGNFLGKQINRNVEKEQRSKAPKG